MAIVIVRTKYFWLVGRRSLWNIRVALSSTRCQCLMNSARSTFALTGLLPAGVLPCPEVQMHSRRSTRTQTRIIHQTDELGHFLTGRFIGPRRSEVRPIPGSRTSVAVLYFPAAA